MRDKMVYLSLGGNIGDRLAMLKKTFHLIAAIPSVTRLEVSPFYNTSPVSDIPQSDYLNAVCRFMTTLEANELLAHLQAIEKLQGKTLKPKNVPRIIDIDILFFGEELHDTPELEIPHPHWRKRLFVVAPLSDLTEKITVPNRLGKETVDLLSLKESLLKDKDQRVMILGSEEVSNNHCQVP